MGGVGGGQGTLEERSDPFGKPGSELYFAFLISLQDWHCCPHHTGEKTETRGALATCPQPLCGEEVELSFSALGMCEVRASVLFFSHSGRLRLQEVGPRQDRESPGATDREGGTHGLPGRLLCAGPACLHLSSSKDFTIVIISEGT
jgi:hypothetical protein